MTQPGDEMTESRSVKQIREWWDRWGSHPDLSVDVQRIGFNDVTTLLKLLEVECQKLNNALDSERAKTEELRSEVYEWLCLKCRTAYPGPPSKGLACIICPKCDGDTGPRKMMELRETKEKLEAERQKAKGLLEASEFLIKQFKRMEQRQFELLVKGQNLETASKNWADFPEEFESNSLDFGVLMKAVAAYQERSDSSDDSGANSFPKGRTGQMTYWPNPLNCLVDHGTACCNCYSAMPNRQRQAQVCPNCEGTGNQAKEKQPYSGTRPTCISCYGSGIVWSPA